MDSEVQRGMESIKSENQAGSALIQTLLFLAGDYVALVLAGVFFAFYQEWVNYENGIPRIACLSLFMGAARFHGIYLLRRSLFLEILDL